MFESFLAWMFMPGTWNDAMVYLGFVALIALGAMFAFEE
jgi:hypothetical protein